MLVQQHFGHATHMPHQLFGLGAEGEPTQPAPTDESSKQRIARIRRRLLVYGLVGAVASGVTTGGIAAATLSLARTERVWQPSLFLALISSVPAAIYTIIAASLVNETTEMETTPTEATVTTPTPTDVITPPLAPAAFGYTNFGRTTTRASLIPRRWLGQ